MRIAMISYPFVQIPPPAYGGVELVVSELTEGLQALGHQVTLYAPGDSTIKTTLRSSYKRAIWPPQPLRALAHSSSAFYDLIGAGEPFDVIHTHCLTDLAFAPLVPAPVVCTLHLPHTRPSADLLRASQCENRTLVAISGRQQSLFQSDGFASEVIYNGLESALFPLGKGGAAAAFLGRLIPEKAPHLAIDAAVAAEVPIRVAGPSQDPIYLEEQIRPRLALPSVAWVGELSHGPKTELLGDSLATLFPIVWEEPFGLVAIESMLCGTPVIGFARGALPEIVDEGTTGWIVKDEVEMAARLRWLKSQPFDRAACREQAQRRFDRLAMARSYERLYHRLTAVH